MQKSKIFFLLILLSFLQCRTATDETPYLVVFSMDGFRWDYQDHSNTPVLDSVTAHGVKAKAMIPSFPTLTFPNHYAIATGLYPGHHGIVHNSFYDKKLNRSYALYDREAVQDSVFYWGNPIWNHLQDQGITTATCFWVGSEAAVDGKYANYWKVYDHSLSFKSRIDTVLHWLQLPEAKRPHFIMAYFSEPDHTGHDMGPLAEATISQVESLDSLLGYFFKNLKALPMGENVNVIITSDHGMAEIDSSRNVILNDFVPDSLIKSYNGGGTCLFVEPIDPFEDSVYNLVREIPHLSVYKREQSPARWHLNDTTRVDRLIIVPEPGYIIREKDRKARTGGAHGYDNDTRDMKTIFYAIGPAFKRNYLQEEFENVHVYPLIEEIFRIPEKANTDGKTAILKNILAK